MNRDDTLPLTRAELPVQPPEQLRYARWLDIGARAGLLLLVLVFAAYAAGLLAPHVPLDRLPELWRLPVSAFLHAAAMPSGWGWLALVHRGDVANLLGIALLAGCTVPALLAVLPMYGRRRDLVFAAICATEVLVQVFAASGILHTGH